MTSKTLLRMVFVITLMIFVTAICWAQEQKVVAEGMGATSREATLNAQRNAVEQTVGTLITSDSVVENDELIRDKILTYSGGYIQSSETVSQEKQEDGSYRVKIRAVVSSNRLNSKLVQLKISGPMSGQDITTELRTKQERAKQSRILVAKVLEPFLNATCVKADISARKTVVDGRLHGRSHFEGIVEIDQDCYAKARQELVSVLGQVGVQRFPTHWPRMCEENCKSYMIAVQVSQDVDHAGEAQFEFFELDSSSIEMESVKGMMEGAGTVVDIRFDWLDSSKKIILSRQIRMDGQTDFLGSGTFVLLSWPMLGVAGNGGADWWNSATLAKNQQFELIVENSARLEPAVRYEVTVSRRKIPEVQNSPNIEHKSTPYRNEPAPQERKWRKRPNWSKRINP